MKVTDGFFCWSYPRWPRSHGELNIQDVKKIIINDASGRLEFEMIDGTNRMIRLGGGAYKLNAYLRANLPSVDVEFIESIG